MKELKFKTSLNCENCVAKVKQFLDNNDEISSWEVDVDSPDKILTVTTESLDSNSIKKIVKRVGFDIEDL